MNDLSILVLFGKIVQVNNARDSGSNQPWKAKKSVDHISEPVEEQVQVVGFSMLQIVARIVDQMPGDSIVQVE